jgi:hypothetical protein
VFCSGILEPRDGFELRHDAQGVHPAREGGVGWAGARRTSHTIVPPGMFGRNVLDRLQVARHILFSESVWLFFDKYVHLPNFDVASDSFATLR